MTRTILHCDCNAFFASVEETLQPELKKVPMAVGGSVEARRGIILAKNELAKKYNIQTAETIYSAKKKCPQLVIVSPHHKLYEEYSKRVNDIYYQYTDMVEKFGIDESWLDVTGSEKLFGNGVKIANTIRERIKEEIGITISVGVSFNKAFAKLGSDYKKPDAVTVISKENYKDIVFPLPVESLLYVGNKTRDVLHKIGIKTIGDLASADDASIYKLLGKSGEIVLQYARGLDSSPVDSHLNSAVKSVGNGITFCRDLRGERDISCGISFLSDSIAARMRKMGARCSVVQVTVKDPYLQSIQRQEKLGFSTNISSDITQKAMEIIRKNWNMNSPIRMLTVTGSGLSYDGENMQIAFFDDENNNGKRANLEKTMDKIREKYGDSSIKTANIINNDIGI